MLCVVMVVLACACVAEAQPAPRLGPPPEKGLQLPVVSLNCRDELPQTVDKDAPVWARSPGNVAERERPTVRSSSSHARSVWPPSLA